MRSAASSASGMGQWFCHVVLNGVPGWNWVSAISERSCRLPALMGMVRVVSGDKPARVIPGRLAENPEIDEGAGVRVGDKAPASIPFPPVSLRRREMEQEKSVLNARKAATSRTH